MRKAHSVGWPCGLRWLFAFALIGALIVGCGPREAKLLSRSLTWAELRVVRSGVKVTPAGEAARIPYERERLSDGARVVVAPSGVAWLRRDGGATLLVRGPADLTLRADSLRVDAGRVFVETPRGGPVRFETPAGPLTLSAVRASLDVAEQGSLRAYVLSGEICSERERVRAGEQLVASRAGTPEVRPLRGWDDWTGGLATTDRAAAPTPFGVGSVGARRPSQSGAPRFPLAIQRMYVRVVFDGDFAVTEVDQTFFNPSSDTVEGLYSFRTPERATLQRFGVDRDGKLAWGHVKEKAAAAAQYQANVYEGSEEDPALLEWDSKGVYRARLYPIGPGGSRRVVVRYAEWLDRSGERGERRLYVYPMAAEGSEESLPHVEELRVSFDLARAHARDVRVGMAGERRGDELVVRAHDFVPRADLALELFDDGQSPGRAYIAPHSRDVSALPRANRSRALERAREEADYVLVPIRASLAKLPAGGLDLAIVVDASAATDASMLTLARAATTALLAQLGDDDRAVVLAGDVSVRPVLPSLSGLAKMDAKSREQIRDALANIERGGASDLGALLADAARRLEPKRRAAVVYIGDATPTVGELSLSALRERLAQLPHPVRIFGLGVGDSARLDLLGGISRGAFAERVTDASQAARAALRVMEVAERPAWLGTKVELGPNVDRVYPRESGALVEGATSWFIARQVAGKKPDRVRVVSPAGARETPLELTHIDEGGDLGRRWAEARLAQMLDDGEGRAALVDLGTKGGIITPVTSLYVPTKKELLREEQSELEAKRRREPSAPAASASDNKEGGTGTRAKGEEGSLGAAAAASPKPALKDAPDPHVARQQALREATEFGVLGVLTQRVPPPATPDLNSPTGPWGKDTSLDDVSARGNMWGDEIGDAFGSGGLGLSGIGTLGGATGQGFGAGHGRLGGSHRTNAPSVRAGVASVGGRLPYEVVQRIVRQNFGRFRLCYERGLATTPGLAGNVRVRFVIGRDGSVSNVSDAGSSMPDTVVSCVVSTFPGLSFPSPENGIVTVEYPILFGAGGDVAPTSKNGVLIGLFVGELPRSLVACSAAAAVPLENRAVLWRERLMKSGGNVAATVEVYRRALRDCEAPTQRERSRLLSLMLDATGGIRAKVELYRALAHDLGAADSVYRGLLARIRTPQEMRELHEALGLKNVDPGILSKIVVLPNAAERVARLGAIQQEFPSDFNVALALLDALEDVGELGAVRDAARRLRERSDADAVVRTAVGELYLRLAARETSDAERESWLAEARRALGEIVEFSPEDPVARRRLGDLLLAHGFFAEAERQYQTLATLSPDDSQVFLLLAAAAEGQGLLEAALKWIEKASAAGAPDANGNAARVREATYLAWARAEASAAKRNDELESLRNRAARRLPKGAPTAQESSVRVTLDWSHPELHPILWSNATGSAMPATEGDVTLGIMQTNLPAREGSFVEVRLEPRDLAHVARLGVSATLTFVFDELGKSEKVVKIPVRLQRGGPATQRFSVAGSEVRHD